ncbi:hypothetical protein HMPREF3166_01455 [Corynebacterium sp. HMSC08A12]|uniref:hypothetical protein n=1 Tax=Corynebacterium sp. HMSC08A12 TaxID=1581134 RepID=UPI0008D53D09|nr:hypothetical protein [Corynebacterium sp. HMSC08A12]OFT36216.1 hypothetical protein HMPREF3166_01455 [Corynebacterium sp. HMSC08A12]
MTASIKQFKQNIADVLPVAKRSQKENIPTISHIRIFNDGERTIMQATDRFIIINSVVEEDVDGGEFNMFVTPETLASIKSHTSGNVEISDDHITINGIEYPEAGEVDWPVVDKLIKEAWDDDSYHTPTDNTPCAYRVDLLKHIKDVEIIPRFNNPAAPTRFKAGARAYGVIQPKRVKP